MNQYMRYYFYMAQSNVKNIKEYHSYYKIPISPLSPKIDFYVDLSYSWADNHSFMLLSKIFKETYYI